MTRTKTFLPSALYYVRTFEQVRRLQAQTDGGYVVLDDVASLENQIQDWVEETKNLVVAAGPVSLSQCKAEQQADTATHLEIRTLAVIYAPALRQEVTTHGQETGSLVELAAQSAAASAGADRASEEQSQPTTGPVESPPGTPTQRSKLRVPEL